MRELVFFSLLCLGTSGCALRATLLPKRDESRAVLWDGVTLRGPHGAEVPLSPRTLVRVVEVKEGGCQVEVSAEMRLSGKVDCIRLGLLTVRPTELFLRPQGPVMMTLNGGVLVAPKERRGDWIRVGGDALGTFEGWVKVGSLGTKVEKSWVAPGLPRFPWVCDEGSWLYDRPGGVFLIWLPDPWCRVSLLEEQKKWSKIEYFDNNIRVVGWMESEGLAPDRHPRFHPGARSTQLKSKTPVYARPRAKRPFGELEKGTRVWASLSLAGRTIVQTQDAAIDVVGWVESGSLE